MAPLPACPGKLILPTLGWGKHRIRLYADRSSGRKPGPTLETGANCRKKKDGLCFSSPCAAVCPAGGQVASVPPEGQSRGVWKPCGQRCTLVGLRSRSGSICGTDLEQFVSAAGEHCAGERSSWTRTTARSAGSCGVLKRRSSACEIEVMTLFSTKFSCILRSARTLWGVPGLFGHECPSGIAAPETKGKAVCLRNQV